ncbi:MAG: ferredoxin [Acidobacteria bacterium]|nr:ferredoxin [Acidobacteriota bacterium]
MTYVVTEDCVDCKYTDCAAVCPVEAFHEECPVEAIYADVSLPEQYADWLPLNATAQDYPILSGKIPALFGPTCKGKPE